MKNLTIQYGDSLALSRIWLEPTVIVSDGPYGIDGYEGDIKKESDLAQFYEPHIEEWSKRASPVTTLWFWNTELGWAYVHPVLEKYGWIYRACCIWDKGIGHIAGNTNTQTLRKFPVVTEVCVHYIRQPKFILGDNQNLSAQDWLRSEWERTGLPFNDANKACEVKNAATRKYLTTDFEWYFPPAEVFAKLSEYANQYGNPEGKPYFSLDRKSIVSGSQWDKMRGKFYCRAGITNVWRTPAVRGNERKKYGSKAIHPNQKPSSLMKLIIESSSDEGDVIWEPFGGLCTAAIVASLNGRIGFAAEINKDIYDMAKNREKDLDNDLYGGEI